MNCNLSLNKIKTGNNIYNLIMKSNLTYEKISEELNLKSPRVIYEWVNGNKMPSLSRAASLAKLLNVQIESLLVLE